MTGTIVYRPVIDVDLALGVGGMTVPAPGGGSIVGKRINLESIAYLGQATWAPAAVAAHGVASVAVAVVGARVGYPALVTFDGSLGHQNRVLWGRVENPDEVLVILLNNDASSSLSVGSGTVRAWCFPVPLV